VIRNAGTELEEGTQRGIGCSLSIGDNNADARR
jgi:hypothetical protein